MARGKMGMGGTGGWSRRGCSSASGQGLRRGCLGGAVGWVVVPVSKGVM